MMQPKQIPQAKAKAKPKPKPKTVAVVKQQPLVVPQLPVVPDSEKRRVIEKLLMPTMNKTGLKAMWLEDVPVLPKVSTGIPHLDDILQGGMQVGGIVTIYGLGNSGKSSLALQIAGQEDNGVVYIDGEHKVDTAMGRRFGGHGDYLVLHPDTIEEAYENTRDALKAGMKLVVIDSLPSFPSAKEAQEKHFDKVAAIAPTAGLNGKKLGILNNLCYEHQATLLIVNQLRANTNMRNQFSEPYHQFGGLMLPSISKLTIRCAASTFIKVEERVPFEKCGRVGGKKVQHEIGLTFRYQVVSSSYCPPRGTGEIPLLFASGFQQEIPDGVVLESIDAEVEDVTVEEVIETLHGGQ